MVLEEERRREGIDSMILETVTGPPEQVAPCIRNALERNWEQALPGSLAEFQQRRKEEIERVCSRYYAEFLGSVQELLTAKSRSAALRQQILRFTDELKRTGQETLSKGTELQRHKATRRNINAAVVVLTQCRELTSLMALAKQQIEDARYYPALRTLDSIAHQLSVAYEQPFVARVQRWLPELATQIKAAALSDVAQWLVVIRSKTTAIGKGALRKCVNFMTGQGALGAGFAASYGAAGGLGATGTTGDAASASTPASAATAAAASAPTPAKLLLQQVHSVVNYTAWMDEAELLAALPAFLCAGAEGEQAFNAALNALPENLDPVHRALHIHAHLGALDEVAQFYANNRLPQATLPTGGSSSSSSSAAAPREEWVAQFQDTLAYYCGFFVTEHLALRATEHPEGLLRLARLEEAWAAIQRDVCRQLEARTAALANPLHIIQLKQTALLVAFTLGEDCFRFNTQPLIDTVRGLRTRYHQAQLRALETRCAQLLEQDGHLPCQVQSDKEYCTLVLPYALDRPTEGAEALLGDMVDDAFDAALLSPAAFGGRGSRRGGAGAGAGGGVGGTRYPKTFPFSALVPKLSLELHRVVVLCLLFGLQLQLPAMETTLLQVVEDSLKALNQLLNKELAAGGDEQGAANFPISKAVQISVDSVTLARMTTEFEKMLQYAAARFYSTEAASRLVPEMVQSKGKREFENTSIAAQHLVFELIQRKIDELLGGMCFIEWEAASPQSRPRPYVEDVVSYLQVTFMCLTHLPKMAREGIHFASCAHINAAMLDLLCDARRVKGVNTNGLHNLSVDLAALEEFADSCGVLQLRECFAELRQTLGTLLHRDVHTLLLDAGLREGVYPKVQTGKLVAILEKYKPLGLFAQVKNQQGAALGTGVAPVDLPYLDKKRVQEYLKALRHQLG